MNGATALESVTAIHFLGRMLFKTTHFLREHNTLHGHIPTQNYFMTLLVRFLLLLLSLNSHF